MRKRKWGRVVNIGYSRAEQLGAFPTIAPYAVAKTGLLDPDPDGRRLGGHERHHGQHGLARAHPGRCPAVGRDPRQSRLGTFEDVAEAVAFCASDGAAAVTGANLIVAGTWKM